jgi:hypothetical protein
MAISLCVASRQARAFLEILMTRDPRCALSQEREATQTLLDQLRTLAVEDPDFFIDLIEGETNLLELIAPSTPQSSTTKPSSTAPKPRPSTR